MDPNCANLPEATEPADCEQVWVTACGNRNGTAYCAFKALPGLPEEVLFRYAKENLAVEHGGRAVQWNIIYARYGGETTARQPKAAPAVDADEAPDEDTTQSVVD